MIPRHITQILREALAGADISASSRVDPAEGDDVPPEKPSS
jgi:hypothetical protein